MSSNSFLVDTRLSLVIANPQHFPMNMGKTAREDSPVESYPVMAYEASNVIPTPFGYKSFFDESTKLNIGTLPTLLVQEIFTYQTTNLDSLQFALCEDGVYVAFATTPTPANWAKIIDTSAGLEVGVRRLWTYATIGNTVYMYQAGQPKFWAIVDAAKYAEAATPSLIAGATRTQAWTNWGAGIIAYVPSFLNMAGQIGLFRADNRLGFWDSDSSIGWSSSVAIEDFKPDAKTFAGSTKFADVQGRIVKVLGSGDNFIIYATRSIVKCIGLDNSPEKWRGEAIMSKVGIAFDTQVVAAQPDQIHYCITQAGICSITDGNPEYIATEVMDYIAENFLLYSLYLIEGRYLFISVNGAFPTSEYGTESILIKDFNNNEFKFPRPTYPSLEDNPTDYIGDWLAGREAGIQQALKDFEPIVDPITIPEDVSLLPCYDVKIFESTFAETSFSGANAGDHTFYSKLTPAVAYFKAPIYRWPVVTNNSITDDDVAPGDFPPLDMAAKLALGMDAHNQQIAYQDAFIADASANILVDITDSFDQPPEDWTGEDLSVTWEQELIHERNLFNCLDPSELTIDANECRLRLFYPNLAKLNLKTYFTGVETYAGGTTMPFFIDRVYVDPATAASVPTAPALTIPKSRIVVPVTSSIINAFMARWLEVRGTAWVGPIFASGQITPAAAAYVGYCVHHHASSCEFYDIDPALLIAVNLECVTNINIGGPYYEGSATVDINYLYCSSNINTWAGSWYAVVNGGAWVSSGLGKYWVGIDSPDGYWGPYPLAGSGSPSYISPTGFAIDSWTGPEKVPYLGVGGIEPIYRLVGTLTHVVQYEVEQANESIVWEAELSGWGYYPPGGFSFRKTHNRNSSTGTCPIPSGGFTQLTPPVIPEITLPPLDRPDINNPPYDWKYPPSIPLPDNYALFQKGSLAAYYPTYSAAAVFDLLLQKWGMYNNQHKLIQELMPVNRVDAAIMPVVDKGMFAGALTPLGACTVFKDKNPQSRITYGKMAFYRRGITMATAAIAHFGDLATGTLIIEASMDGVTVDPLLSYAVSFVNQRNVTLPFTTRAKWFNIRLEGSFNLTYLELLAESRGRR